MKKIHQYIQSHQNEIIEDLLLLVQSEASTDDIIELSQVREVLNKILLLRLNQKFNEIEVPSTRNILSCQLFSNTDKICLVGHYDTVHKPHTIDIKLDHPTLYGPGVLDMKAGLIQAIWACKAIQELNLPTSAIQLLFNGDEEKGSRDSKEILLHEANGAKAILILEPGCENGDLKSGRKGAMTCEITIYGKAAHAGNHPEDGINAIHEIAYHIIALQKLNNNPFGTTVNVDQIQGGKASNVICDEVTISIDIRYKTLQEKQRIEEAISQIPLHLPNTHKKILFHEGSYPLEESQTQQLLALAKQVGQRMNLHLGHQCVGGASDGNRLASLNIPLLDGLGAIGKGIHVSDEQIDIPTYLKRIEFLIMFLVKINESALTKKN